MKRLEGRHLLPPFSVLLIALLLAPAAALSDGLSGNLEVTYSHSNSTTSDPAGFDTKTQGDLVFQRYRLVLDRSLYPNLLFSAQGLFDRTDLWSTEEVGGVTTDSRSTFTRIIPTVDLRLGTPFVHAGAGFNRVEDRVENRGQPSETTFRDTYSAYFGMTPSELPTLDVLASRQNIYDKDRQTRDTTLDAVTLALTYSPLQDLILRYQGGRDKFQDHLEGFERQSTTQSARIEYFRQFFGRSTLHTSYSFSSIDTNTSASGQGEILFPLFPSQGLSALSNTPFFVALDPNPGLIDGNLTASAGINIGPVPPGGDDNLRNMGLDFLTPTEVNTLYVWVDRQLPAAVSESFPWDLYTSADNLNWTLIRKIQPAPFGLFDNRFEISFPNVTARYVKVVTRPLSPAVPVPPGFDVSSILVTEIQAFNRQSASEVRGKSSQRTHLFDIGVKTMILDSPTIYHDVYFWYNTSNVGQSSYFVSNLISLYHRLSPVFSVAARASAEYGKQASSTTKSYNYGAVLTAVPLSTLSHTLVMSGRYDSVGEDSQNTLGVSLNNNAQLYRGISLGLTGGWNTSTIKPSGRKQNATFASLGVTLDPNPALSITLDYTGTWAKATGGDRPDTSNDTTGGNLSVSFRPFPSLYVYASIGRSTQTGEPSVTLQDYSVNFQPYAGSPLQFSFSYIESLRSSDNAKQTVLSPIVTWKITQRAQMNISYLWAKTTSDFEHRDDKSISANFRTGF